jgi:hypothetical protein
VKLSLLIASRGRPTELLRTIREIDRRVAKPDDLTISVALDLDDGSNPEAPETRSHLVWHVGEREDSLGAKYNRAARYAPAQTYVLGSDDNIFTADGWDELIRQRMLEFPANFGFVYFGRLDGTLPTNMALPHRLIERQGFLFPEFWPVWFHDTWVDEIAHMTGRILWASVDVEEIGGRGKSRGVRDIAFWAMLFDATRNYRTQVATELSREHNPQWLQTQLMQRRDILNLYFASRMVRLRDPATAHHFEQRMSFDAPEDERYLRIKAQAKAMLAKPKERAA